MSLNSFKKHEEDIRISLNIFLWIYLPTWRMKLAFPKLLLNANKETLQQYALQHFRVYKTMCIFSRHSFSYPFHSCLFGIPCSECDEVCRLLIQKLLLCIHRFQCLPICLWENYSGSRLCLIFKYLSAPL